MDTSGWGLVDQGSVFFLLMPYINTQTNLITAIICILSLGRPKLLSQLLSSSFVGSNGEFQKTKLIKFSQTLTEKQSKTGLFSAVSRKR